MDGAGKTQWLVKSAARILGPFATGHVIEKIRSRELSSVDEVEAPYGRWRYLKEISEFDEAIKLVPPGSMEPTATMPREETITTKTDKENELIKDAIPIASSGRATVYSTEKMDGPSRLTLVVYLAVFLVMTSLAYMYHSKSKIKSSDFDRLFAAGMKAYEAGDFPSAIESLELARRANPNNLEALYALSLSHVAERHTVVSRRLFDELSSQDSTSKYRLDRIIGESVVAIENGELNLALEKLEIAFATAPKNAAVLNNLAVTYFKRGEFDKAKDILKKAIDAGVFEPEHYMLLVMVELRLDGKKTESMKKFIEQPQKNLRTQYRFYQDMEIVRLYWLWKNDGQSPSKSDLKKLLDEDPEFSTDHRRMPLYSMDLIGFSKLKDWCLDLSEKADELELQYSLKAYCEYRNDQKMEAIRTLDTALARRNNLPLVRAYRSFMYYKSGQTDDAWASSELSMQDDGGLILPHIVRARICLQRNDSVCMRESWEKVISLRPENIPALAALGALGDRELQSKVKSMAPGYRVRGGL